MITGPEGFRQWLTRFLLRPSTMVALGGLACHKAPPPAPPAPCTGPRTLIVKNATGKRLEIYRGSRSLGVAGPGRSEFELPVSGPTDGPADYFTWVPIDDSPWLPGYARKVDLRRVRFETECKRQ